MRDSKKIIITGGPGAGKTSLLMALQKSGYSCSEEVSRRLISEKMKEGSQCLPWIDLACFADKVLLRMIQSYQESDGQCGVTFFDRGIPDIVAYLKVAGLPIGEQFDTALHQHPYSMPVFILPPWKDIYVNDPERWQTYEEAVVLYESIKETYYLHGYKLIEVPQTTIEQRVKFIQSSLHALECAGCY